MDSPASSTALSTSSVELKVTHPTPLNSCVSRSLSHRTLVTVPADLKKLVILSPSIDHGRLPRKSSTQPSGFSFCGLKVRCGLFGSAGRGSRGLEKLMRAGRPPRSTPWSATALVAASTDSKSTKAMPRKSPFSSTNLMREMAPQSLKAARTVSSSMFHERLPRKIELDGSGSVRSFFAVATATAGGVASDGVAADGAAPDRCVGDVRLRRSKSRQPGSGGGGSRLSLATSSAGLTEIN